MADEFCWLVEQFNSEGNSTGLYMADQIELTVTTDPLQARRFTRSRSAMFRAEEMDAKHGPAWRATQHGFMEPSGLREGSNPKGECPPGPSAEGIEPGAACGTRPEKSSEREAPSVQVVEPAKLTPDLVGRTMRAMARVITDEQIDTICAPGRASRWKCDGRQYDRDTVRLVLARLADEPTALQASAPSVQVPDGWKLLPPKLTGEMRVALVKAALDYMRAYGGNSPEAMYEAAFEAAPEAAPVQPAAAQSVPLTDEQIDDLWDWAADHEPDPDGKLKRRDFARKLLAAQAPAQPAAPPASPQEPEGREP